MEGYTQIPKEDIDTIIIALEDAIYYNYLEIENNGENDKYRNRIYLFDDLKERIEICRK